MASKNSFIFPQDYLNKDSKPFINFKCDPRKGSNNGASVFLPFLQSFNQSDQAGYGTVELGSLGFTAYNIGGGLGATGGDAGKQDALMKTVEERKKQTNKYITALTGQAPGEGASKYIDSVIGTTAGAIASDSDNKLLKGVGIGQGSAMNKHPVTEFTGMGIRTYSFSYSLVPSSKEEAEEILNIIKAFRYNIYPSGNDIALSYPPKWSILFSNDIKNKIEPIDKCFLTSFETSVNENANTWFYDSHPADMKISMSFTETRAQTFETLSSGFNTL